MDAITSNCVQTSLCMHEFLEEKFLGVEFQCREHLHIKLMNIVELTFQSFTNLYHPNYIS